MVGISNVSDMISNRPTDRGNLIEELHVMNFRQLEIFGAVMREGTTIRAAHLLNMSQPAISTAIVQLEKSLHIQLFERVHGRLRPTDKANQLYEHSLGVFSAFHSVQSFANEFKNKKTIDFCLSATPSIGSTLIPLAMNSFRKKNPEVKVSILIGSIEEVQKNVAMNESQVGFYYTNPENFDLRKEEISDVSIVCAVPLDHSLVKNQQISADNLILSELITYQSNKYLDELVKGFTGSNHDEIYSGIKVRFVHSACEFVARGVGIALVDSMMRLRSEYSNRIVFLDLYPALKVPIYVCEHRDSVRSELSTAFIKEFQQICHHEIKGWSSI